jgi:hypothetical protein
MVKNSYIKKYLWIATAFLSLPSCNKDDGSKLRFINPIHIERVNEVVKINYNDFANKAGDLPTGTYPLFMDGNDTLVSQVIDLNADGTPEEILIEISLSPDEYKDIRIDFIPAENFPVFPAKTNVHFAYLSDAKAEIKSASRLQTDQTSVTSTIFQMEGPAWENDKVGFRNYYDLRNGIDIFGKKIDAMVLDTVGTGEHSYHLMSNWGMDILKVSNSLGAGSIGMEKEGKLYRIGDNGSSGFERIYEGPLKSEFVFRYNNWKADSDSFSINHYISITSGTYCYESNIYANFPEDTCNLIAGFVNKYSDSLIFDNSPENHVILATHCIQAEDSAALGMAVLIPRNIFKTYLTSPKSGSGITETHYAVFSGYSDEVKNFFFYAGWATGNLTFEKPVGFLDIIKEDALKLDHPVKIQKLILP